MEIDGLRPFILVSYLMRIRTTVRLDSDLVAEAKRVAVLSGRTLTAVIEEALRESLVRRRKPERFSNGKLPTFRRRGTRPGVNLDDSAALLELMERDRDSRRR